LATLPFPFKERTDESIQEAYDLLPVETTFGQVHDASEKLTDIDTAVGAISRLMENHAIKSKGAPLIDPRQLNRQYPDLGNAFTEPMSAELAALVVERQRGRQDLQAIIDAGGDFAGLATFTGGAVSHLTDPREVGLAVAAELTMGATLGATAIGRSLFGFGSKGFVGSLVPRITLRQAAARGAAETLIESSITEPLIFTANKQDQIDVSVADTFKSIVIQSLIGGAFRTGIEVGVRAVKFGPSKIFSKSLIDDTLHAEATLKDATHRVVNDRLPKPDTIARQAVDEITKKPDGLQMTNLDDQFIKLEGQDIGNRTFFGVTDDGVNRRTIGDYFGDGDTYTDSSIAANGTAAGRFNPRQGKIIQVIHDADTKLLNLEGKIPAELRDLFKESLGKIFKSAEEALDTLSGVKIYEALKNNILDKLDVSVIENINTRIAARGFDGLRHEARNIMDQIASPQNVTIMFDKSKIKQIGTFSPDPNRVFKQPKETTQDLFEEFQSFKSEWGFDANAYKDFVETGKLKFEDTKLERLQTEEAAGIQGLEDLNKQGFIDEAEIKALKETKIEDDVYGEALRFGADCVRING